MGQQQLLLLVLATVIVGLATVAGIQAFEQGSVRANQDALTNTAVKLASDIQAQTKEPEQFGGYDGNLASGTPQAKGNITLSEMGYETSSNRYNIADGECIISTGGVNSASLSISSASEVSGVAGDIKVTCASEDNSVTAGVAGLDSDDITSKAEIN